MVDQNILLSKLGYIEKNLVYLESLGKIKEEDFLESPFLTGAAKYYLQTCIEAMLDIANHVIARERYRAPDNYVDALRVLGEHGILPNNDLQGFYQMARFRNRIVHLYQEVDNKEVYKILQTGLDDFKSFIRAIMSSFFYHEPL
ncbi:MAG: type VII toxin-antitoxin system HepT family RNase toxin [Bacillota bacterium]